MHNPFSPLVPHSAPAAALLLILPLLLTDTDSAMAAADCGPAGSFSTPQERHAVTNAETAVDNGLGALSRAAAKLSGGMVAVSASRSGIRVSDPTDRVISGLRNRLGTTLPRVKRGTPDIF